MPLKRYRAPQISFTFPFRIGGRSMATGKLNAPTKPGGATPSPKQFTTGGAVRKKKRMK